MLLLRKAATFLEKRLFPASARVSDIGQAVLMLMVLLVVADVTSRRVFNNPLPYVYELVGIMLAVVVFFAVAYCGAQRGHLSIDVLVSRFPAKARAIINAITCFFCIGLCGLIGWRSLVYAMHTWDRGHVTAILRIPLYPFVFVVAFGSILLGLVFLVHLLNWITESLSE